MIVHLVLFYFHWGYLNLNENKIELDGQSISDITSRDLESDIKEMLKISNIMGKIGIKKDNDLSCFDKKSQRNIKIIY